MYCLVENVTTRNIYVRAERAGPRSLVIGVPTWRGLSHDKAAAYKTFGGKSLKLLHSAAAHRQPAPKTGSRGGAGEASFPCGHVVVPCLAITRMRMQRVRVCARCSTSLLDSAGSLASGACQ
eukprot:56357-Chlamydomonas_euryale.AAC.2